MSLETVYFVQISDTHIGPTVDYGRHGHVSYPCAKSLVRQIQELPVRPDFVVHTGDVVTDPHPDSYRLAAEIMAGLEIPVYYVNGNHDRAVDLKQYFSMGPRTDVFPESGELAYHFERKGYRFLVVDGRGPDEIDPHGIVSEAQLDWIRRECRNDGPPLLVFIHFPVVPMGAPWLDANMRLLNWLEFHQALLPARDRLRGVFHGHIHQHMQILRDGILYVSAASAFSQFASWPTDEKVVGLDPDHQPGFSFVRVEPDQTVVRQHVFPREEPLAIH